MLRTSWTFYYLGLNYKSSSLNLVRWNWCLDRNHMMIGHLIIPHFLTLDNQLFYYQTKTKDFFFGNYIRLKNLEKWKTNKSTFVCFAPEGQIMEDPQSLSPFSLPFHLCAFLLGGFLQHQLRTQTLAAEFTNSRVCLCSQEDFAICPWYNSLPFQHFQMKKNVSWCCFAEFYWGFFLSSVISIFVFHLLLYSEFDMGFFWFFFCIIKCIYNLINQ